MQVVHELKLIDRAYNQRMQRVLQAGAALGFVIYLVLLPMLAAWPKFGLRLLWFLFIPIAPMFLLAAPNAWVSLCPLSTVQTLARRFGWKKGRRLSPTASLRLQLVGWALLFVGVPTRHLIFNTDGAAVLVVAGTLTLLAVAVGLGYYTLSGWCVGACPIRPVEVLYGQMALDLNRPENCTVCDGCVPSCVRVLPEEGAKEFIREPLARRLAYALPGFVAAYFLLDLLNLCTAEHSFFSDAPPPANPFTHAGVVYAVMALGSSISFVIFWGANLFGVSHHTLFKAAAVAAYSCYYLGVVPEILEAWSLKSAWGWALLAVPFLVLATVLLAPRRSRIDLSSRRVRAFS
jgi:hypothetical protein